MQAVHAPSASVPAADPSGGSGPSAIPKPYRYSSRSNSFSSASVVTVKRTASLSSSSTGARNSALPRRAQSPGETSLIALRVGREQSSQDHRRRKSVAIDATERPDSNVLKTSHKHSSSAASSINSASNARRSRASSGAVFGSLTNPTYSPKKRSAGTIDYSPRTSLQKQQVSRPSSKVQSPASSPERERRRPSRPELTNPLNNLPSLHATPALTDPNDVESPSTIQTVATPSTQTSAGPDYFYDGSASPYGNLHTQTSAMIRDQAGPLPSAAPTGMQATGGAFNPEVKKEPTISQPTNKADPRAAEDSKQSKTKHHDRHRPSRAQERGELEKKAMLSKALEKANAAVHLDNAQDFDGAMEAYADACTLLQQVMDRSSGSEDKRKLEAIKSTYTGRIEELRQMEVLHSDPSLDKELPAIPSSEDSSAVGSAPVSPTIDPSLQTDEAPEVTMAHSTAEVSHVEDTHGDLVSDAALLYADGMQGGHSQLHELEQPRAISTHEKKLSNRLSPPKSPARPTTPPSTIVPAPYFNENTSMGLNLKLNISYLPPEDDVYIPAPLSPKRSNSPERKDDSQSRPTDRLQVLPRRDITELADMDHNNFQLPWLDTIDEDRSSRASSVHSVSSQQGLHRKYLRAVSGVSNPDFDAAFDAAVEAAYDQGLEPDLESAKRGNETVKGHAPNESIVVRSSQIAEISSPNTNRRLYGDPILGADEEEERILDDIAQTYAQTFSFDASSKSALPRQSDSSGYSRSTWQSSQNSDRTTAGTSLSTVAEDTSPAISSKNAFATASMNSFLAEPPPLHPPPPAPPPQSSLPKLPPVMSNRQSGVRSRRLSGQNLKQLKIETPGKPDARERASTFHHASSPFKEDERLEFDHEFKFGTLLEPLTTSDAAHSDFMKSPPSLDLRSAVSDGSRPVTATTPDLRQSFDDDPTELLSTKPTLIKKNKSSVSLREHMVLLASPTAEYGPSLVTPLSSTFMTFVAKRNNETPLTSQRATLPSFGSTAAEASLAGGLLLFDTSLTAPDMPSSPKSPVAPIGVEPCPESFLLRPFWLMRNIAATLTHPKGAFLTSKLFVPRQVWQAKGVKLKSIEDKIANCDLLTAALGRLAGVDTFDADAVMEELQMFEEVMERVQNALIKRLGSEVGVGGLPGVFKEAPGSSALGGSSASLASDAATIKGKDGKGYLNSWRKLRSKSSGPPIISGHTRKALNKSSEQDGFNMASVPMTSWISVERRGQKRDVRNMVFEGENRHYMSSLASLFEGVQVLDQIARQVEDPGLRAVSSTHVGMELSIRHAAEFFGFYICRFVLADLGMLLDKFVKRGSEWVLA